MVPIEDDAFVGVEKWKYMALRMASGLRQMADRFSNHLPPEMLVEASEFLDLLLQIPRQRLFGWKPYFPSGDEIVFESALHEMRVSYSERTGKDVDEFDKELIALDYFIRHLHRNGVAQQGSSKKSLLWGADFFVTLAGLSDE